MVLHRHPKYFFPKAFWVLKPHFTSSWVPLPYLHSLKHSPVELYMEPYCPQTTFVLFFYHIEVATVLLMGTLQVPVCCCRSSWPMNAQRRRVVPGTWSTLPVLSVTGNLEGSATLCGMAGPTVCTALMPCLQSTVTHAGNPLVWIKVPYLWSCSPPCQVGQLSLQHETSLIVSGRDSFEM